MDAGPHIGDAKIHAHRSADCAGFCASAVRRPFRFFEFVRGAKGGSKSPKHRRLLLAGELGFAPARSQFSEIKDFLVGKLSCGSIVGARQGRPGTIAAHPGRLMRVRLGGDVRLIQGSCRRFTRSF
jgi:hypothetical protein